MEVVLSTGAKVSLIAQTYFSMGDLDGLAEYAARVCYRSVDRMGVVDGFVQKRILEGHESVIEHASATFLIDGISRACAQQLTRHRLASFSMESQRYTELRLDGGDWRDVVRAACVIPPSFGEEEITALYLSLLAYTAARKRGNKKEDARFLLPMAVRTSLVMTANMREWRHIIKVRGSKAAQWEVREAVLAILSILSEIAPETFRDLKEESLGTATPVHDGNDQRRNRMA
ncbi:MAG: FAD-dependent thymidylate synthase [Candidatus Methanomethylicaceae archaeon]